MEALVPGALAPARSPAWSRRLAAAGMAALLALLLAGALAPATGLLSHPAMLLLPTALAAAIAWSSVLRIRERAARRRRPGELRFEPQVAWGSTLTPDEAAGRLEAALSRRWFRVRRGTTESGALWLVARRGSVGFWGSIAFHAALVGVLAALLSTLLFEWRGTIQLVEGERAFLDDGSSLSVTSRGRLAPPPPRVLLALERFEARQQEEAWPAEYRAEVLALEPSGRLRRETLRVNAPLTVEGTRLFLQRYGMAPVLRVRGEGGAVLDAAVPLSVLGGREDAVPLPDGSLLRVRYFGDPVLGASGVSSRSDAPRNPALGIVLETAAGGVRAARALVHRGREARLGPYEVSFPELRLWAELGAERDPGEPILLAAFALGALGLLVRLLDQEREIRVRVSGEGAGARIEATGRCRWFPSLLARDLQRLRALA